MVPPVPAARAMASTRPAVSRQISAQVCRVLDASQLVVSQRVGEEGDLVRWYYNEPPCCADSRIGSRRIHLSEDEFRYTVCVCVCVCDVGKVVPRSSASLFATFWKLSGSARQQVLGLDSRPSSSEWSAGLVRT